MLKVSKKLSLMLALVLLVVSFASCGAEQPVEKATPVPSTSAPQATESSTQDKGPSWTWDTTPITLTWFVDQDWYKKTWDIEKCLLDKKITEETGVKVDIVSGNGDKLNALIASDSLPDIVSTWIGSSQRQVLEKSKMVLPFNELVENYAPDFNVPKSMQGWFSDDNGKYYGYVNYFYAAEDMQEGNFYVTHNNLRIRKDLADQLGIKVSDFDTKEGMLQALRKVRDAKLEYDGLKVTPFYPAAVDIVQAVQFITHQFGSAYEDKNGNWLDYRKQPEALEAIQFFNQMHHEGLMPTDAITLNREQIASKVANGSVFMLLGIQVENSWKDLAGRDENAVYQLVGPVKGEKGNKPYLTTSGLTGWTITMITAKAKNPDRAVRFLNYMAQPDMVLEAQWGPKGVAWNMVDGHVLQKPEVIEEYKADWAAANLKYGDGTFPWLISWLPIQRTYPKYTKQIEFDNDKYEREVYGQYVMDDKCFADLVVDAGTEESGIAAKIDEYWLTQVAKMIVADPGEVASMYEQTIKQMDAYGWQKWSDAMNVKFQKNKEKLGLKFAYPPNQN